MPVNGEGLVGCSVQHTRKSADPDNRLQSLLVQEFFDKFVVPLFTATEFRFAIDPLNAWYRDAPVTQDGVVGLPGLTQFLVQAM